MKLYNIYEGLILESIGNEIDKVISGNISNNGKKYWNPVRITYRSQKSGGEKTTRQVMIYGRGILKSKDGNGNPGIRVFQAFGDTQSENASWKTFIINNISHIEIIDFKFYMQPSDVKGSGGIPDYVGPRDKKFTGDRLKHYITF